MFIYFDPSPILQLRIQERTKGFTRRPDIYRRRAPGAGDITLELNVSIPDWAELRRRRELDLLQHYGLGRGRTDLGLRPITKSIRTHKGKGNGRQYTSRYRGVHQTFPTRRWEAQFRRNGKPTSLGCFDYEEEAARAYDKMMLWCELHNASGMKGGMTNFDAANYDGDIHWLQQVTQDELVQILRSDGRRQAAQRLVRQKRDHNQGVGPAAGMAAAKERESVTIAAVSTRSSIGAYLMTTSSHAPQGGVPMPMAPSTGPSTGVSSEHTQG